MDRVWRDLWAHENEDGGVSLQQLEEDGRAIPGALILTVRDEDGEEAAWLSVPYSALRDLRHVLNGWLDPVAAGQVPLPWVAAPLRDDDLGI